MKTKSFVNRILIAITALLTTGLLAACGGASSAPALVSEKLQVVATIFPAYDWARNILGDNPAGAALTLLVDNGVDLHSYQPSAEDILRISSCDLFIYVGGESDQWVEDALKEAQNPDMIVVNLMDALGDAVREEELIEGMEPEEEEGEEGEEEAEYDEHIWLSLTNAIRLCQAISDALCKLDPLNTELYQSNLEDYSEKLSALDSAYQAAVSAGATDTVLFGDRFPFRYLTEDYGLKYYAAFAGCSAETEASFETIAFLAEKIDELSLHSVFTIDGSDQRLANAIIQMTRSKDQSILVLDSIQSVSSKDIAEGKTYLSIMGNNLEVLKQGLE
ncbi:MAG: zinc ABC transporter substrate-binding protein [Lachnospiraceae bacterium]|nr:zinc ABC transporter substrate-binding protein [Lachnospiraceae bacterium]